MSGTGTADHTTEREQGDLRRSLGFRDLVVYGLLFIAPMAPVGVYGTLDAKSHGAVALVCVVATVAMTFTAFSYAQMVRVVPQAGVGVRLRARGARQGGRVRRGLDGDAGLWRCWTTSSSPRWRTCSVTVRCRTRPLRSRHGC
jgi:hypothetical protein